MASATDRTSAASFPPRRRGPHNCLANRDLVSRLSIVRSGGLSFGRVALVAYAGICACITARITVPINGRTTPHAITKSIIDLQLEITASAQRWGSRIGSELG